MTTRREVLGDAHVDRAMREADAFTNDFQEHITRYAWGAVWSRPGLDRRTRSCITVAMLAAQGNEHELEMHLRAALRNGVTVDELKEVLLQVAVYAGLPRANRAFAIARGVIEGAGATQPAAERPVMTDARAEHAVGADFVQSLARGLAVIRAFDAEHPELTLSDVARAAGLTRASARRFLRTLTELGYVRSNGRLFALRPRVLELGYAYLSSLSLHEVAQPHLERLVATLRESSSVSVLDADDVVYIARVPTRRIMTITISVGTRFPAYATSMGRVLLAGQSDEWLDGYFASVELRRLTARTVTDVDALRAELLLVRASGVVVRRRGARGGIARHRRPDPRPVGARHRGCQRVVSGEPGKPRSRA